MANRRGYPSESKRWTAQKGVFRRSVKAFCNICGGSLDIFHDDRRCQEDWLKRIDAEGNPSNTRGIQE